MTPEDADNSYREAFSAEGEIINVQRKGVGLFPALARVTQYQAVDMQGGVQQGKRHALVLGSDLVNAGFPFPFIAKQDRIVWGSGITNAITAIDNATRRVQGVTIVYDLEIEGA